MGIDGDSIDIVIVVVILYFILLPEYFGMRRNTPKPVNRIGGKGLSRDPPKPPHFSNNHNFSKIKPKNKN